MKRYLLAGTACACAIMLSAQVKYPPVLSGADKDSLVNQMPNDVMPVFGVWVWGAGDLQPDGYKKAIDMAAKNSPFNLLVPFLRFPDKEVVDEQVYQQVKLAAAYAVKNGIGLLPDLDVRSARRAFMKKYPGEQQEMLRLKEIALSGNETALPVSAIKDLNDHYSGGQIPKYNPLESSLLRVYAYMKTPEGIDPASVRDITQACQVTGSSADSVMIRIPPAAGSTHACAMVSFTLFYPDIFGPHLMQFQREILDQYANLPLSGACKDEWGFPPYYPRFYREGTCDFWYSRHRAKAYAEKTNGRELLSDCLLMAFRTKGKEAERQTAINHFREMSFQRNTALENSFYQAVKSVFGPDAAVTVHPTWWPWPDQQEFRKNGLDWWAAKRDWAQTDETVPVGVRTALSKKWNSPVWYNMYYTARLSDQVWGSSLGGGRIDYLGFHSLFDRDIMRAETRIRLLNYISKSPLDCPVAVVFGHASAMNWAGSGFDDVGMALVDSLWHAGYPADLIPTSEIENGSLKTDENGAICYGPQKYAAIVLYQPEFEKETTSAFFKKAARGSTTLFRIGEWTRYFNGEKANGDRLLPKNMMRVPDVATAFQKVIAILEEQKIAGQTPATVLLDTSFYKLRGYEHTSFFPPNTGFSRLIDGTHLFVAGTSQVSGDPIRKDTLINGHPVSVDAIGVAGIRLDGAGNLEALAASDLSCFKAGNLSIRLEERTDFALWKDQSGNWKGVIQADKKGKIPDDLAKITSNWSWLKRPVPPAVPFAGNRIDRKALVGRHHPVIEKYDPLASLSVGNGNFAFTTDFTGLQTFYKDYEPGVALGTMSNWAWHTLPNTANYRMDESYRYHEVNGRRVPYQSQQGNSPRAMEAINYFRSNPHRLHLGIIRLAITKADGKEIEIRDIRLPKHQLHLWKGRITSNFEVEGKPVSVTVYAHPEQDLIAASVQSPLIGSKQLAIEWLFPYGAPMHTHAGYDFDSPHKHSSVIEKNEANKAVIHRQLDEDHYFTTISWTGKARLEESGKHRFRLQPATGEKTIEFSCLFSPERGKTDLSGFNVTGKEAETHWENFWQTGGAVDFSACTDTRAPELERRVVLSQYLTKVNGSGNLPPQETGLTFNSWFGKFHLEMIWWHSAHFYNWQRPELMAKQLGYYRDIYRRSVEFTKEQGYPGVRWPKMVGPDGINSPSSVGSYLIWQQPHLIYLAEQLYQANPSRDTLLKYQDLVFETAAFMAGFARYKPETDTYALEPPLIPAQEHWNKETTVNPPFELAYWHWGLSVAVQWKERLGQAPDPKWGEVAGKLAVPYAVDGLYMGTGNAPDSYSNPLNMRDHPVVLGMLGMLPKWEKIDEETMRATLKLVMEKWDWPHTWGWDYPMAAMCATRLNEPELALEALLKEVQKNTYLINGHNYQDDRLRIYLPGNGGLLKAVALMCAGWQGNSSINPGFPADGQWQVKWENLTPDF